MKKCKKCKIEKSKKDFYFNNRSKDKLTINCKSCIYTKKPKKDRVDKKCTHCKEIKKLDEFSKSKRKNINYSSRCKKCAVKLYREYHLNNKYGISISEYNKLLKLQNNKCCICKKEPDKKRKLCVDHCHSTNKIRGLLCDACNIGLGNFKDNIEYLKESIKYLENNT